MPLHYDEELPLIRMVWTAMFQRAPDMQASFTIQDLRIIRDLVRDGHGWSVLPDYHCLDEECVGFSQWTGYSGVEPFKFYLTCIREYFEHRSDFKGVNLVLQTAWRVGEKDYKKDLFADYGVLSRVAVTVLGIPFTVVEISYSQEETINIVKSHLNVTSDEVRQSIKKYTFKTF